MEFITSLIYVICGLSSTILSGKGKYDAFIFGLISCLLYSMFCFKNALWGAFLLNCLYYIPIQCISLILWKKNTNFKTKNVKKLKLKFKTFLLFLIAMSIISLIVSYILSLNQDKSPYFDGFITAFSILGAYFTMRRYIEQWIVWSIVNLLSVVMWIKLIMLGKTNYGVALLWFIYLVLGIIFYFEWKKEINSNQQ